MSPSPTPTPTPSPPKRPSESDLRIYTSQPSLDVPAVGEAGRPPPVKFMCVLPGDMSWLPRGGAPGADARKVNTRIPKPVTTPQARRFLDEACKGEVVLETCMRPHLTAQETFNARSEYSNSEDDGSAQHRINQYLVKQEIGRGSFGAVHLAVDQYGQEYVRIPAL
jgi:[calcium/calmodulin-dependent protein kinase] kinase